MEPKQVTGAASLKQRTRSRARRDKGKRLITARDRVVLTWVDLGLVSYERVYQREPGWISLTALGFRRNELMRSIDCKKCWRRPMSS